VVPQELCLKVTVTLRQAFRRVGLDVFEDL
jgi:hypothetical protein